MKYFVIAGEASGDLHASNLIKEIRVLDPNADFEAWGGDKMQKSGAKILKHYKELAFMGFIEVIKNLPEILKNLSSCKKQIQAFNPAVIIFIDYPGFNLRIAKWAKALNYKTIYYISPQIWAWKASRVHLIKKVVDLMMCILPFEKEFYKKYNYEVKFVGHPLLDEIKKFETNSSLTLNIENAIENQNAKKIIAILPGSRKMEISMMLSEMLKAVEKFPDFHFVIAGAPSIDKSFYDSYRNQNISIVFNRTYELLKIAHAAIVTSGTATLETALFGVPQVVCYKGNNISYHIAKMLIKVKYISLVNLIMDEVVVKELIQEEMNSDSIVNELNLIINETETRSLQLKKLALLKIKLGNAGASTKAAKEIVEFANGA